METLLVARAVAAEAAAQDRAHLRRRSTCEMRCCAESKAILDKAGITGLKAATEEDFHTE